MNQEPVIVANNIRRVFRSAKTKEGLKGTLSFLLKPEYVQHEAVKGVSFSIQPGEFVGLIGANGAGKTTVLKMLSGLIPPTSGEARVLGYNPFERKLDFRRKISLVMGQKAQLWWDLPARDAFKLLQAIYEIPNDKYLDRLKTLSHLLDVEKLLDTQIRRLSLGERMKMELIGAILHWPSVVFLDEPTIGLDVLAAHKLREFLKTFNQMERSTIILTSHNMDDIQKLCPRVLIIKSGELIYDGSPNKLTQSGERRLRVRFLETPSAELLLSKTGLTSSGQSEEEEHPSLYFTVKQDEIVRSLDILMKSFQVTDMGIEEQSLENVIHRIYEGANP